jgi:hypothetical protein
MAQLAKQQPEKLYERLNWKPGSARTPASSTPSAPRWRKRGIRGCLRSNASVVLEQKTEVRAIGWKNEDEK